MHLFIKTLAKNLVLMLVRWPMVKWVLSLMAKQTTNQINDNIIQLVDAAYNKDEQAFKLALEVIVTEINQQKGN